MKHNIVLALSLISCLPTSIYTKNAAALVLSEESAQDEAAFSQVIPTLPGAIAEADTKSTVAVRGFNKPTPAHNNTVTIAHGHVPEGTLAEAIEKSNLDMLRKLLAAGSNPNDVADGHITPLGKCILKLTSKSLSKKDKEIVNTIIFELLNAGAENIHLHSQKQKDARIPLAASVASAMAFYHHLFDVGALILEHGASGENLYRFSAYTANTWDDLTDLAGRTDYAQRHYANTAIRAGSRGRSSRNECLEQCKRASQLVLKHILISDVTRIVLDYHQPSCPHIHFTAFSSPLDYPLVAEDAWRKQKPGSASAQIESAISGYRRDNKPQVPSSDTPTQGCDCTVS